ncbi:MAG: hypothetical protein QM715_12435 [Nibricoccus sp.]
MNPTTETATAPTRAPECDGDWKHLEFNARQKIETRLLIGAHLFNEALKGSVADIQSAAFRIEEAGLFEGTYYAGDSCTIKNIIRLVETLNGGLNEAFPLCYAALPAHLNVNFMPFDQAVSFFRQEVFWTTKGVEHMHRCEEMISKMREVYALVRRVIDEIDHSTDDGIYQVRNSVPAIPANLFFEKAV